MLKHEPGEDIRFVGNEPGHIAVDRYQETSIFGLYPAGVERPATDQASGGRKD